MRSDVIKKGPDHAPVRAMLRATGGMKDGGRVVIDGETRTLSTDGVLAKHAQPVGSASAGAVTNSSTPYRWRTP